MLLLQCGFANQQCVIWGERTPRASDTAAHPTAKHITRHPFAATRDELIATIAAAPTAKPDSLTVWLPTVAGKPVPSSPLLGDLPEGKSELTPWQVPVCGLDAASVLDLLAGIGDNPTIAPGVGVGVTVQYPSVALRFATALVAREQFLPDVVRRGKEWFARWTPTIAGADATRFDRLAKVMPPACRAIGETLPDRTATEVLRQFIAFAVDQLVRGPVPEKPRKQFDSVHDHWLHALRSATGAMSGSDAEVSQLAAQVREWRAPITATEAAPFRLCFRLDEPSEQDRGQTWHVRYLLQGRDDPSLHVPAADVWAGKARVIQSDPKPTLLAGLGQAANLSTDVDASLKTASPTGFTTTTDGAHRFLNETAWLLEQAGFGVLLPAWWTGHATKQKLEVTAKVKSPPMSGGSGLSLEDLVEFRWAVAIGDEELTLKELEELAKQKASLVRLRGKWVQVNADDIRAAIELLKKKPAKLAARDVMKLALGIAPEGTPLPTRGATATGWIEHFLKELTTSTFAELEPPAGLKATLRPYQVRGYSWLAFLRRWGLGACLADDMGLGKTVQTLSLLLRDRGSGVKQPVLLVCPMSVVGNWSREAARFAPELPLVIHHGPNRAKTKTALKKATAKAAVVLTSYGLLARDRELFEALKWSGVILDEAQTIKNSNTKTAQAARAMTSEYRVALTGTPVENHVGDLWALGQFLNPGLLGSEAAFRRDFFTPIQRHQDTEAMERLKRLTGPFLLRRLKTDPTVISDLPAKIETTEFCTLTREQASLYAAVVKELDKDITGAEGIQRKGMVLGALSKLKQVCNHPAQFLGDRSAIPNRSGKLARLTEMLEELLDAGDKALVFTQFTEMGDIIRSHLQETFAREVLFLHGGTSRKQRDAMVQRIQSADGPPVFLLSLKAGGTGLNLTAATHVFHFDRWWNPAVETQATDRAFRIGQTRTVQVHAFVCSGTLEEKIDEMLTRKRGVAAKVVGTGEGWLTELGDDQLREVLALRPDAVED
jgi:SNF2 family DNA or RNA helicase